MSFLDALKNPMTPRQLDYLRTWLAVGGTLVGIAIAWANLNAQMQRLEEIKADKVEVESLKHTLDRVDERTAVLYKYICRERSKDLGC